MDIKLDLDGIKLQLLYVRTYGRIVIYKNK